MSATFLAAARVRTADASTGGIAVPSAATSTDDTTHDASAGLHDPNEDVLSLICGELVTDMGSSI